MTLPIQNDKAMILGIPVDPFNMETAVARIEELSSAQLPGYVCFVGVHGIMEAQRSADLAQIYGHAALTIPDGMPTVWIGWQQGLSTMSRVAGPDLMLEIFRRRQFANQRHFFYGGKAGVAEDLRRQLTRRFPWVKVVGTYTPPFRDLSRHEEDALVARLHALQADMVWVGISTPKQERFMMRISPRLPSTLMFGVGAAYDFHTGRIKDSPQWVKAAGMQWLHRLIQDPRHLFWRYFRSNSGFLWRIALQLTGLRSFPQAEADPHFRADRQSISGH